MADECGGIETLPHQLTRFQDEQAIISRLYRVCSAVDGPDEAAWLDCFTEDGVFTWAPSDTADSVLNLRGHNSLAAWFNTHRASTPIGTQTHLLFHPVVVAESCSATVQSSYVTLRSFGAEIVIASTGRYADRLTKSSDGVWRLAEHVAIGQMSRSLLQAASS